MILELRYLLRYASGGLVNTLFGFFIIFASIGLGISPVISNILGYASGIILGFFISKKFVFRTIGSLTNEGFRYLLAFSIAFVCNLCALHIWLIWNPEHIILGQIAGMGTYTTLMYLLIRFFVFPTIVAPSKEGNPPDFRSSQK